MRHQPDLKLPDSHPMSHREAYQCDVCKGISYPPMRPPVCPYCVDDAEGD